MLISALNICMGQPIILMIVNKSDMDLVNCNTIRESSAIILISPLRANLIDYRPQSLKESKLILK